MAAKKTTEAKETTPVKKTEKKEIRQLPVHEIMVEIAGDSDLILNKMTDEAIQDIIDNQTGKTGKKAKEAINKYQRLIESIHWMDEPSEPLPEDLKVKDYQKYEYTEEGWHKALNENRVGYDASGIKKGICEAVVRVLGESKSTIVNSNVHVIPEKANLVPITFEDVYYDESIITNYKGNAFLTYRNVFSGWKSKFKVRFMPDNISFEQVIEIIQAMGFAGGLGAHRVGLKGGTNGTFKVINAQYV